MKPQSEDYDYNASGFDNFLSRSVDDLNQANLDAAGPQSKNLRFDGAQISGALGDTFRVGNILIDGAHSRIDILDDNGNVVVRMGELGD